MKERMLQGHSLMISGWKVVESVTKENEKMWEDQ